MDARHIGTIAKFVVPSAVGAGLFLVVVPFEGQQEMLSGVVVSLLGDILGDALVPLLVALVAASAVLSVWHRKAPLSFALKHPWLDDILSASPFWTLVRVTGALMMIAVFFGIGPDVLTSGETGGNMLFTVAPTVSLWYLVGGIFLPLMTDYGLIDLLGVIFRPLARPLFRLPGRAMVNCFSSWFGSSVCGVYLTISQYEKGFYTARESVVLISCFSLLSISFCSMIASMLGLGSLFGVFYGTIAIAGIACALILPRLWPIVRIPDAYDQEAGKQIDENVPEQTGQLAWGWKKALERAEHAPSIPRTLANGGVSALNLMTSTLPSIMTFGTIALVVATRTNVFDYLGVPLGLYLSLFGIPNAMEVGATVLVGFADQFVPVVLGSTMPSVEVRFLIGCMSILQILYMTDIGALILTSKVPFSLWQMFVVYAERVLICVPIVVACAHLFGIM